MTNKTKAKYEKLIQGKRWTKQEIHGFVKALNSMRFSDRNPERVAMIQSLYAQFQLRSGAWSITKEQTTQGINYLRTRYFKLNGEPRSQCPFGYREQGIIKRFRRFEFSGIYEEQNPYGSVFYHPIYRVIDRDGNSFEYTPVHWGTPLVHG